MWNAGPDVHGTGRFDSWKVWGRKQAHRWISGERLEEAAISAACGVQQRRSATRNPHISVIISASAGRGTWRMAAAKSLVPYSAALACGARLSSAIPCGVLGQWVDVSQVKETGTGTRKYRCTPSIRLGQLTYCAPLSRVRHSWDAGS